MQNNIHNRHRSNRRKMDSMAILLVDTNDMANTNERKLKVK